MRVRTTAALFALAILLAVPSDLLAEEPEASYDHFVGWFEVPLSRAERGKMYMSMPNHTIVVPVIKRGTDFFTAHIGFEVPLQQTPEGLYLKVDTSEEQQRLTIGFRPESNEYYARIVKRLRHGGYSSPEGAHKGEVECVLVKTEKPSWALDAKAKAPQTLDDFVGWYQSVYISCIQVEVYKEDERFFFAWRGKAGGKRKGDVLDPREDGTGFTIRQQDGSEASFRYDQELEQFETCFTTQDPPIRMPFARIKEPPSQATNGDAPMRWIGIPFKKD